MKIRLNPKGLKQLKRLLKSDGLLKETQGWYHSCGDTAEPEIIFVKGELSYEQSRYFQYGPFKTFQEAKEDALAYFTCDLNQARYSISYVRGLRKPKGKK